MLLAATPNTCPTAPDTTDNASRLIRIGWCTTGGQERQTRSAQVFHRAIGNAGRVFCRLQPVFTPRRL